MGNIEQEVPFIRAITNPFIKSRSLTFIKHVVCARQYCKFLTCKSLLSSHDNQGGKYHHHPHFRVHRHK